MVSELEKQINRQEFWRKMRWLLFVGCIVGALALMLFTQCGCFATPAQVAAVEAMPEKTEAERIAKADAARLLKAGNDDEETYWMWGKIGMGVLGLAGLAERAYAARKAGLAVGTMHDTIEEATNIMPEVQRKEFKQRMINKQIAAGTQRLIGKIHDARKARGKA